MKAKKPSFFHTESERNQKASNSRWKYYCIDFRYPGYQENLEETTRKLETWDDIEKTLIEMTSSNRKKENVGNSQWVQKYFKIVEVNSCTGGPRIVLIFEQSLIALL